jgi:hypothetical protein
MVPLTERWENRDNPLRRSKYDARLFHEYNWGVAKAIKAYDEDMAVQRQGKYPKARINEAGQRICGDPICDSVLTHQRSFLCEAHREGRYQSAKYKAYRLAARRHDESILGIRVSGVPRLVSDGS